MIFPMRRVQSRNPPPSLGSGTVRYKPLIPLTIIGPAGQWGPHVLVDSGADDVVFPAPIAPLLGIHLPPSPQFQAGGIGGRTGSICYAPAILVLTDAKDTYRWRATVGFTTAFLKFPLFGIAGGLGYFRTTLDGFRKEVDILAQPNLPATQDAVP